MCVLAGRAEVRGAGQLERGRADQRQQAAFQRSLVQLQVVADAEAADQVEQRLQRRALGVEQQLLLGGQDPQIAEHLALGGQEPGITALACRQRFDVVGDLALEELPGLGAGQRQLAALGAVEDAARLGGHTGAGLDRLHRRHAARDGHFQPLPQLAELDVERPGIRGDDDAR